MLLYWFLLVAVSLSVEGRRFNNPVIDNGDYPDPGAIKVGDKYFVVTTTNNNLPEKFPIHTSTDLENWTRIGYLFDSNNPLSWSNNDQAYWAPEIHKIGDVFRAYYTAGDKSGQLCIGISTATNPEGPYKPEPEPLFCGALDSSIVNDNGTLYLVYMSSGNISIRPLNRDGLSFSSEEEVQLMTHDLPWEDDIVEGPFYVRRNQYHYLFYSGHGMCSDLYSVGIARSLNPMGPYEKRGDPILVQNDPFRGPGHCSIVKDINNIDDVIVYHSFKKDHVCDGNNRVMLVSSVGWGDDDWPYVYDNNPA